MMKTHDYIVAGAGAAGCVIAARLSENPSNRVLLIEAGGARAHPFMTIPALAVLAMTVPGRNYNFETEPVPAMNNRRLVWAQGRGLGGSSAINGMIYLRGHASEYDQWAQLGCTGWSYDGVLPYFKRAEANERGASALHGGSGPMRIKRSGARLPITDAFIETIRSAGIPDLPDLNCNAPDAIGYHDLNIDRGRRASSARAYLTEAKHRPNLTILTDARVRKIAIEKGRAVGIEVSRNGSIETIRAEREVIVSCGAIQSPQLLMLSGIGPANHLKELGIPVIQDSPHVGQHLRNHANLLLQYACSKPVTAYRYMSPAGAAGAALSYLARRGPLADSCFAAGGYFRTDPALEAPDIYCTMSTVLMMPQNAHTGIRAVLPTGHGFMVAVSLGRAVSEGAVRLRSADPLDRPRISPNTHGDPSDIRTLTKGVQRMREMLRGQPIRDMIEREIMPGPEAGDDASVAAVIRAKGTNSYHPMGTCRMGDSADSVIDPELRVRGISGLRVADASIIPTPIVAATHAPTIMIGEKAADLIGNAV